MKRKNEGGITLIAFSILIIVILALAFTAIYLIFWKTPNTNILINESKAEELLEQVELEERLDENEWNKKIVSDITSDNIPIPQGFSYVQGNLQTGLIIEENEDKTKFLFIPYKENISDGNVDYYQKVDYLSIESDVLNSIKKYNGFFVNLNSNFTKEDLKSISQKDYKFQSEQQYLEYENNETVNSHILYKEELSQINNYLNNNNINLGENTIGIQALVVETFASLDIDESITTSDENIGKVKDTDIIKISSLDIKNNVSTISSTNTSSNTVYMYEVESDKYKEEEIPIPDGFKYDIQDGIVSIQDEDNPNMIYIWVPLSEDLLVSATNSNSAKNKIWNNLFQKYAEEVGNRYSTDTDTYKYIFSSKENWPEGFVNSIKKWKGFYISEAELGYTESPDGYEDFYNKARGMVENDVTKTIHGGDYFRGSTTNNLTIETMNQKALSSSLKRTSVVGHVMYGIEWDATLLWIANTKDECIDQKGNKLSIPYALAGISTNVGKYKDSGLNSTSNSSAVTSFNKIWGLGGNLAEVTQETYNNNYIIRGGSWKDSGGETTNIASRFPTSNIQTNAIGFRTALCIKENATPVSVKPIEYDRTFEDDTVTDINGIKFTLSGNLKRWVNNWEGTKIYKTPNQNTTEILTTLDFAKELTVTAKAQQAVTTSNGKEIIWAKVQYGKNIGYVNASDLTENIKTIGDNVNYITGDSVKRFFNKGIMVYSIPKTSNDKVLLTYTYAGSIDVIGKSTNQDQEWAVVKVNGQQGFVRSSNLLSNINMEKVEDYNFILGNQEKRYILEDANAYSDISNLNETKKLNKNKEIIICGISEDRTWAKIIIDNELAYIETKYLTIDKISSITEDEENQNAKGAPIVYIPKSNLEWANEDLKYKIYITIPDTGADVKNITVNGKRLEWQKNANKNEGFKDYEYLTTYIPTERQTGTYTYKFIVTDTNNNFTEEIVKIKIDTVAPTIKSCTIKNHKVTMKVTDDFSGLLTDNVVVKHKNGSYLAKNVQYTNNTLTFYIDSEKVEKDSYVKSIIIEDNAGNSATYER